MATLHGPALGKLDPDVLALRAGYIAWRDELVESWHTEGNAARWAEERAQWIDGEPMICTTEEIFFAASKAGLDDRPFTHRHDPDQKRLWGVPGKEGGPLVEVAIIDGDCIVVGRPDDPNAVRQTLSEIARKGGNSRWQNAHG